MLILQGVILGMLFAYLPHVVCESWVLWLAQDPSIIRPKPKKVVLPYQPYQPYEPRLSLGLTH